MQDFLTFDAATFDQGMGKGQGQGQGQGQGHDQGQGQYNTSKIHIRVQQMGKKWITSIEGLDDDLDLNRIARAMKKTLNCAATVSTNNEGDEVIQLQGYQRDFIQEWLVVNEVMSAKEAAARLVIHGA